MSATGESGPDMGGVLFEDLAYMEEDFDEAELEILRAQEKRYAPLYAKRDALVSKIEHFWTNVFEEAPTELDQWIQPTDSQVFAEALKNFSVSRFEIDEPNGSPRSFSIKFTFSENQFFENTELEKKFWHRRAADGSVGLFSEPVPIKWKPKQDLTKGVNDALIKLWQAAQQKKKAGAANGDSTNTEEWPEYKELVTKMQTIEGDAQSFFTWFSWVADGRYITAEESVTANAKHRELMQKRRNGEKITEEEEVEEDLNENDELYAIISEVFPVGEDIANLLADEIWPNAINYYKDARLMEYDDEDLSEMEEDEDDDDSEGEEVDIRALVSGKGKPSSTGPPSKKRKA